MWIPLAASLGAYANLLDGNHPEVLPEILTTDAFAETLPALLSTTDEYQTIAEDQITSVNGISAYVYNSVYDLSFFGDSAIANVVSTATTDNAPDQAFWTTHVLTVAESLIEINQTTCDRNGIPIISRWDFITDLPSTSFYYGSSNCDEGTEVNTIFRADRGWQIIDTERDSNGVIMGVLQYNDTTKEVKWVHTGAEDSSLRLVNPFTARMLSLESTEAKVPVTVQWAIDAEELDAMKSQGFVHFKTVANYDNDMNRLESERQNYSCTSDGTTCEIELYAESANLRNYQICVYSVFEKDGVQSIGPSNCGPSHHAATVFVGESCRGAMQCAGGSYCFSYFNGYDYHTDEPILTTTFKSGVCNFYNGTTDLCYSNDDCHGWGLLCSEYCLNSVCTKVPYSGISLASVVLCVIFLCGVIGAFLLCCYFCLKTCTLKKDPPITPTDQSYIPSFKQLNSTIIIYSSPSEDFPLSDLPSAYHESDLPIKLQPSQSLIHAPVMGGEGGDEELVLKNKH